MNDTKRYTLGELNALPAEQFTSVLGGVFEGSAWIAEQVASLRPLNSFESLMEAMVSRIEAAGTDAQLRLIRAHPELAGKLAIGQSLTPESSSEQHGAGLSQCSPEEYSVLQTLNQAYREKFGFPFVLAVRGHNRQSIIHEFQRRLALTPEQELAECLAQVYLIGRFRLADLIEPAEP